MTIQDYAATRPDLLNNWNAAHNRQEDGNWQDEGSVAEWIRGFGSYEEYLQADHGGPFIPPAPAPQLGPMPPITVNSTGAQAYLNSRPDLANNWANAWQQSNANDGVAQWIRSFGSFQAYLQNDHGGTFSNPPIASSPGGVINSPPYVPPYLPPSNTPIYPPLPGAVPQPSAPMPPLTLTDGRALAHAQARPDLENNWRNAWAPGEDGAIGNWIRSFGNFQAYVLNDLNSEPAAPAGPGVPLNPGVPTAAAAKSQFGTIAVIAAVGLAFWLWNRER